MRTKEFWAVACALALLAGCTGLAGKISNSVDEAEPKTSRFVREVGRTAPGEVATPKESVVHEQGIWVGKNVVKGGPAALPAIFYEAAAFDRSVSSLSELAERITLRSGVPIKVSPDALAIAAGRAGAGGNSAAGAQAAPGLPPLPGGAPGAGASAPSAAPGGPIRITYTQGNFKGLLDMAAARFGVHWKYADGTINFYHTDSRTFQINAIPGDSSLTATINSGATSTGGVTGAPGGGGATGISANNSQNTAVASKLSVYTSIESSIKAMLSAYGKVVASPATGSITVVDTPDTLERIASFIDNENKSLSRQVMINVTVLSVNLSDADEYGINWDLVYNGLKLKYGIKNSVAASPNAVGFSAGILGTSGSSLSGTSLLINALSEQGKVRRQTTASVVTLNNQPVPVQVAKQTSYLQSSQTTVTALVGTSTTLTPGTVTSGFNMSILPHILANGTVMLQFSTDISALRQIRTVSSNGTSIESPELDTRNFLQRVAMKSNETLIISGFEQTDENLGKQGVGIPENFLFGGALKARAEKEVIVVLITPSVMSGS
jgi:type IVB pilus formation R64 PilN family outer membrane protein